MKTISNHALLLPNRKGFERPSRRTDVCSYRKQDLSKIDVANSCYRVAKKMINENIISSFLVVEDNLFRQQVTTFYNKTRNYQNNYWTQHSNLIHW